MHGQRPEVQGLKHWKIVVHGHDKLLQIQDRYEQANAAHAITMLKCKQYAIFIGGGDLAMSSREIDDEWQGR
jgi:hypothetical protein